MRALWWYAIGGGVAFVALVAVAIILLVGTGGGTSTNADDSECEPAASTASAGSAEISARALGTSFSRRMVIRIKDKESGIPLHDANVEVRGEMTCPHLMPLLERRLRETSTGTYKGNYNLIMEGHWTLYITVRSKEGNATTSALPIEVRAR